MINMTSSRSIERNSKLANIQSSRPNQCGQKVIHYLAKKKLFGLLDLRENSQVGKMGPFLPIWKAGFTSSFSHIINNGYLHVYSVGILCDRTKCRI